MKESRSAEDGSHSRLLPWPPVYYWLVLLCGAVISAVIIALKDDYPHDLLVGESGFVEAGSAVLWIVTAIVLILMRGRFSTRLEPWVLAYLSLLLGFRELDGHKRIFEWNLSKLYNLIKPEIPAMERLVAILFIFLPLLIALFLLWRFRLRRLFDRSENLRWRGYALGFITLVVAAYLGDKITWLSEPLFNLDLGENFPARAIEESLELALASYATLGALTIRELDSRDAFRESRRDE